MRRSLLSPALSFLAFSLASAACGDKAAEPAATPTTLTVAQPAPTLQVGQTLQLAPVVKDSRGATMANVRVRYTSDAPDVVLVDSTGLLTAKAVGTAHVTALAHPAIATVTVTVEPVGGVQPAALSLVLPSDRVVRVSTWQLVATSIPIRAVNAAGTDLCGVAPVSVRADSAIVTAVFQRVGNGACVVRVIPRADGATWLVVRTGSLVDSAQVIATTKMRYIWSFRAEGSDPNEVKLPATIVHYRFEAFGEDGRPLQGMKLKLSQTGAGGGLNTYSITTDSTGRARVDWALPTIVRAPEDVASLIFEGTLPDGTQIASRAEERVKPDRPAFYFIEIEQKVRTSFAGPCTSTWEGLRFPGGRSEFVNVQSSAEPDSCRARVRLGVIDRFGNSRAEVLQLRDETPSIWTLLPDGRFEMMMGSSIYVEAQAPSWLTPIQVRFFKVVPPVVQPPRNCPPDPYGRYPCACPDIAMCPPPCAPGNLFCVGLKTGEGDTDLRAPRSILDPNEEHPAAERDRGNAPPRGNIRDTTARPRALRNRPAP